MFERTLSGQNPDLSPHQHLHPHPHPYRYQLRSSSRTRRNSTNEYNKNPETVPSSSIRQPVISENRTFTATCRPKLGCEGWTPGTPYALSLNSLVFIHPLRRHQTRHFHFPGQLPGFLTSIFAKNPLVFQFSLPITHCEVHNVNNNTDHILASVSEQQQQQ
jgi:hypothetical protein